MQQYWEIKAQHFDKILLFKLGKFYEIFYDDAVICQKLLDLNWMGGAKKLHVGFPEKALMKFSSILVNQGFTVAVVEQCETPKQMEKRVKNQSGPKKRVVLREVANIFTKGTFADPNEQNYEGRWTLVFKHDHELNMGVVFFDPTTLQFFIGQYKEDSVLSRLRTLVS